MSPARAPSPLVPSGLAPVEGAWGGFHRGGAYLLVGPARGGRLRMAAHTLSTAADAGEGVVVVSPRAPDALVQSAAEARFDLAAAHAAGTIRMLRLPAADALSALGDAGLAAALEQLGQIETARLVVEDFTPLVGPFRSFEAFQTAFRRLLAAVEARGTTLLLGLGEPANPASQALLASLQALVAGTVRLHPTPTGAFLLTLVPGTAHDGPERETLWQPDALTAPPPSAEPEPQAPALFTEVAFVPATSSDAPPVPEPIAAASLAEHPTPHTGHPAGDGAAPGFAPTPPYVSSPVDAGTHGGVSPSGAFHFALSTEPFVVETPSAAEPFDAPLPVPDEPLVSVHAEGVPSASSDAFASGNADAFAAVGEDGAPFAGIEAVPTNDPLFAEPWDHAADLFASDPGLDALARGHLVDSDAHGVVEPPMRPGGSAAASATDVFEASVAPIHAAAYPEVFTPRPAPPSPAEDFRTALTDAFGARETEPFLVLALRMEPQSPHAAAFGLVAAGLRTALGSTDHLLADEAERRLVVLLPGRRDDAARALFAATRAHLATTHGDAAGPILASASALVVPNGHPFTSAAELFAYVMG